MAVEYDGKSLMVTYDNELYVASSRMEVREKLDRTLKAGSLFYYMETRYDSLNLGLFYNDRLYYLDKSLKFKRLKMTDDMLYIYKIDNIDEGQLTEEFCGTLVSQVSRQTEIGRLVYYIDDRDNFTSMYDLHYGLCLGDTTVYGTHVLEKGASYRIFNILSMTEVERKLEKTLRDEYFELTRKLVMHEGVRPGTGNIYKGRYRNYICLGIGLQDNKIYYWSTAHILGHELNLLTTDSFVTTTLPYDVLYDSKMNLTYRFNDIIKLVRQRKHVDLSYI